jgi:hypothetical protein
VRPSSLTALPHSSHLSLALSPESSLVGAILKLYERLRERPRPAPPPRTGESQRRNRRWVMRPALADGIMPTGQDIRWQQAGGHGDGLFVAV